MVTKGIELFPEIMEEAKKWLAKPDIKRATVARVIELTLRRIADDIHQCTMDQKKDGCGYCKFLYGDLRGRATLELGLPLQDFDGLNARTQAAVA
jgi:hypothetical protein